jgi:hypothetical protein
MQSGLVQPPASGLPPPHWLGTPMPPQMSGGVQLPQSIVLPQPSATGPQLAFCWAQVRGTQFCELLPQTLGVPPPPQELGEVQVPQPNVPPQPSATIPQFLPNEPQVAGVQAGPASIG